MATKRSARWRKYDAMLPLVTEGGIITGFLPDDWQIKCGDWQACCQDPRNWVGYGEIRPVSGEGEAADPWYWHGYRQWRFVRCKACARAAIATEYLWPEGESEHER